MRLVDRRIETAERARSAGLGATAKVAALLLLAFLPFGKIFLYRALFRANIASGVRIGFGAVLLFDDLTISKDVRIGPLLLLRARTIAIGTRSRISPLTRISVNSFILGPSCNVDTQATIKGDRRNNASAFTAGAECWIFSYCYIDVARPVTFGRNVGVGGGSRIFTHGFWLSKMHGYPVAYGAVTIGNDVWLPWDCFIMPGVHIGDGAVVGARSTVTGNIPANALAAGTPAKVLREKVAIDITTEQRIEMLADEAASFCAATGRTFARRREGAWELFSFDGREQIAIASGPAPSDCLDSHILRVVHQPLSTFVPNGPAYSVETFQCTPRRGFNAEQAGWLDHLRGIGARHYPVDEVVVEVHRQASEKW